MKSARSTHNVLEILIAEDSATQRVRLQHLLEERGYAVVATPNGEEALTAARRHKPTLVITDVLMPELDGYGLCKALKSDHDLQDVPVILLTTLSDARDVVFGLECGADNFIRKPYDAAYLFSRIDYLLMNQELRKNRKMQMGIEIKLGDQRHFITAERLQILDLLISIYEQATYINKELKTRESELARSNQVLDGLYHLAAGLNATSSEQGVARMTLERTARLSGVQAGWIVLREGSGFRLAAASGLPPSLATPGALEGDCQCQRRLLAGELGQATNILECERLNRTVGQGPRYHASVPLRIGERTLGVMNLIGPAEEPFDEEALNVLSSVGNQVALALERARLHGHLEDLVEERTAAVRAEIAERVRAEASRDRLTAILEATPDFVAMADTTRHGTYLNAGGRKMLGLTLDEELANVPFGSYFPPGAMQDFMLNQAVPTAIREGVWVGETTVRARDGRDLQLAQTILAHKDADGDLQYLSTIGRDITESKAQEAHILRLNRVYAVLSGINTTIVRVQNRQELLDETCRIVVEQGEFRMAWIGFLDDAGETLTLAAKAGPADSFFDNISLSVRQNDPDTSLVVTKALRDKQPVVCNDIENDALVAARWREATLRLGYGSSVVFPLVVDDKATGVLALYAVEKNFFNTEEMALLTELAGDVSFALDNIEKRQRLDYLAYYDVVTGLPNRNLFYDRVNQHLREAGKPDDDKRVAMVVLDLERFRTINETFGRNAGDHLLRQVAERLTSGRLSPEHLSRISGDSFAAVLHDVEKNEQAVNFVQQRVIEMLNQPFTVNGQELRLSARAGIALFPSDGADADTLFRNAEAALKRAKASGDRYLFYTAEFNARMAETLALENKLRSAVELEQLVLHYQPKVDLQTGQMRGLEALMRWNDPTTAGRLIPPLEFIPVLEETGMIIEAGRWALGQAVADYRRWRANGLQAPRIAVNVSAIQLRHKDFVDMMGQVLAGDADADADAAEGLELEITESLIMRDIESNIEKLRAIRDMGVTVAVDDFGTGYSSLSYIAKLPINTLKIDRTFIVNMSSSPDDLSIVSTIISLAHSLNLTVVAEGVETEEQANLLRLLKCDEIQGYLFSPAVPAPQIEQFIAQHKTLPTPGKPRGGKG